MNKKWWFETMAYEKKHVSFGDALNICIEIDFSVLARIQD